MKIISKRGRALVAKETPDPVKSVQSCADPVYFLNSFFQLQHLLQGTKNITLYPYQEEYVRTVLMNKSVIAVMPRQAGLTSISIGYLLWEAMFHADQRVVIGASNLQSASQICQILHTGVQLVPANVRPPVTKLARNSVQFNNGSSLLIGVCSPTFLRGMSPTRIFFDNFAFVSAKIQHDTFAAIAPSLGSTGCILASTPNGVSNTFARVWEDAQAGSRFVPFRKTIMDLPQYDAQWRTMMKKALGDSAWRSEFECEFS